MNLKTHGQMLLKWPCCYSSPRLKLYSGRLKFLEMPKQTKGKISKFLNDNSLLNQIWIMDPKKKVSEILKENSSEKQLKILDFIRYKVGEGV